MNCYKITIYNACNMLIETYLKSGETIEDAILQVLNETSLQSWDTIKIEEL